METITLADGTVLDGAVLDGGSGIQIYVRLNNMSILDGVTLFSDQEKISVLTINSYGHERTYEGFTELWSVSHEFNNCNLVMRKPA